MIESPVIKICGVKTPEILEHVIAAGADMVGFVHFSKSPRHLDFETIAALAGAARGRIETAILLVDPDDGVLDAASGAGTGWLQLHGRESTARVSAIRDRMGKSIIKALPVGAPSDLEPVAGYLEVADRLILDARPPKDASRPGGLGTVFDWEILKALDPSVPFMLSGGLDSHNVADAVARVRPFGLDVSSGVERDKGVKDAALITDFIARARAAARM